MDPYPLIRPGLFALDPEQAHRCAIGALKAGLHPRTSADASAELEQTLFGLRFANPIGLAAGFDKDGEVPDAALALGFGFVEIGTVTPLPQEGNPRPRVFRLKDDEALINRLGFNSAGHAALASRITTRRPKGILGVNIGANKDSADRIADYASGVATFAPLADYLTVNISSPNTPGLRALQTDTALGALLDAVMDARARHEDAAARSVPVFVKIAPDFDDDALRATVDTTIARGVDGLIVSNTTVSRPPLKSDHATETGGLSGRPLFDLSTRTLAKARLFAGDAIPLIGVGGVSNASDALTKIRAGARLVQLYTALVYAGPALPRRIVQELPRLLRGEGFATVAEAVGVDAERVAAGA